MTRTRARECSPRPSGSPRRAAFSKADVDAVTARRWEQYEQALDGFQKRWMVPITVGSKRKPTEIDGDWGIRPAPLEALEGLSAVEAGGVTSYGSQTHPADGCAGLIVTSEPSEVRILSSGFARVGSRGDAEGAGTGRGRGAAATRASRWRTSTSSRPTTRSRSTTSGSRVRPGADLDAMNPFGCSLIYGHPQGPTGARGLIELIWALHDRGGGRGLFTGCAAGDTGAALVIELG